DAFWSGGISNPLEVIEQITYLLFIKRLDDLHTLVENKANTLKRPIERPVFPEGMDGSGRPYEDLRWHRFREMKPEETYEVVGEHVFPFLRNLGGDGSTYSHHMKDARFTIPNPALLARVVDMLDDLPMKDRDTKGVPDALARWRERGGDERKRARTKQSFCVPKEDTAEQEYDLSLNRYKEIVHEQVEHRPDRGDQRRRTPLRPRPLRPGGHRRGAPVGLPEVPEHLLLLRRAAGRADRHPQGRGGPQHLQPVRP